MFEILGHRMATFAYIFHLTALTFCLAGLACTGETSKQNVSGVSGEASRQRLAVDVGELVDQACECSSIPCGKEVKQRLLLRLRHEKSPAKSMIPELRRSLDRMGDCLAELQATAVMP